MTNEQAMHMLKAKLECLKRETSGTDFDCNNSNCDECSLNYEQGNMGEQKQALDMAIKALEQQPCEDAVSKADVKKYLSAPDVNGDRVIYEDDLDLLPSVTPTQKWTPCSKGLPDPQDNGDKDFSDWVQITINIGHPEPKDPYVTEGYYCYSEQKWYTKRFVVGVVTAWMPLPEPYRAESEE